ncbi:MAG: hypothetical protein E7Z96_07285 [Actinomycetaceae bacterium]|nr:hypothetical protein [Actinomycetaceae bacterium]
MTGPRAVAVSESARRNNSDDSREALRFAGIAASGGVVLSVVQVGAYGEPVRNQADIRNVWADISASGESVWNPGEGGATL